MTSIVVFISLGRVTSLNKYSLLFFIVFIMVRCSDDHSGSENNSSQGVLDTVLILGGSLNDVAKSVIATTDGGFAILGYTQSLDGDIVGKINESFDFWLLKLNSNLGIEWDKTYGGTEDDRGGDLIQTSDGGYVIAGYTGSSDGDVKNNNGNRDFWIAKTDRTGNLLWENSFGFSGADEAFSLIETNDNHYIVSGVLDVTASEGQGNNGRQSARHAGGDFWTVKISLDGKLIWSRFYGGSFTDSPRDILENAENELLSVGTSDSYDVDITKNKGTYDFWVVKSNMDGDLIWEKSFGGGEIDEASGITATKDGAYLIVGDTRSDEQDVSLNMGAADLWIIKISDNGELLWDKSIGGSNFDVAKSICPSASNGYIIAGSSRSSDGDVEKNQGQNDAWIVKIGDKADLVWELTVGGSEIDFAYDAVQLIDGSIIAVGETSSSDGDIPQNKGFTDLLIIKVK